MIEPTIPLSVDSFNSKFWLIKQTTVSNGYDTNLLLT